MSTCYVPRYIIQYPLQVFRQDGEETARAEDLRLRSAVNQLMAMTDTLAYNRETISGALFPNYVHRLRHRYGRGIGMTDSTLTRILMAIHMHIRVRSGSWSIRGDISTRRRRTATALERVDRGRCFSGCPRDGRKGGEGRARLIRPNSRIRPDAVSPRHRCMRDASSGPTDGLHITPRKSGGNWGRLSPPKSLTGLIPEPITTYDG